MCDNIGIVICSRLDSKRLPGKPFLKIAGKPIIEHLLNRLVETGIKIFIAVPEHQYKTYKKLLRSQIHGDRFDGNIQIVAGDYNDPLFRTLYVARNHNLETIIRVCHDKIFIDYRQILHLVDRFYDCKSDYMCSNNFIDGMKFEIFSRDLLERAHSEYKNVEHMTFALLACAKRKRILDCIPYSQTWARKRVKLSPRLLIDYQDDFDFMEMIFKRLNNNQNLINIEDIIGLGTAFLGKNQLPEITVYTASYNDFEHLDKCIQSTLNQKNVKLELLLIDDGSTDKRVSDLFQKYQGEDKRVRFIQNGKNLGLANSSNIAIAKAKSKYIMRIDADDYLAHDRVLYQMLRYVKRLDLDVLYPNNFHGNCIQSGHEEHHVGGALFKRVALDYVKFFNGIRHFDGLELYNRLYKLRLKIGYWSHIGFFYRQRPKSLSRSDKPLRAEIKRIIKNEV